MVRPQPVLEQRYRPYGLLVLIALVLGGTYPYAEKVRNANELPRILQGIALVEQGVFTIDDVHLSNVAPGPDLARTQHGARVPNKPPGTSLVAAGAYAMAKAVHGQALTLRTLTWWVRLWSGLVPTLVLAWVLAVSIARVYGPALARVSVMIVAFATPGAAYAKLAYGHQLAACFLLLGISGLVGPMLPRMDRHAVTHRERVQVFVAGACAGASVGVEYMAAFAGLPLTVWLVMNLGRARARGLVPFAVMGAALPLLALAAYHNAMFGSAWETGYHHATEAAFAAKHGQGFLGLMLPSWANAWTHLAAPATGLLWWFPLAPFALLGLVYQAFARDEPSRTWGRLGLSITLLALLVVLALSFQGGWRVGPRYLVYTLPMLAWGLAEIIGQASSRHVWIALFAGLAVASLWINLQAALVWPHFDDSAIVHPLGEVLIPLQRGGFAPYGPIDALRSTQVTWLCALAAVALVVAWFSTLDASMTNIWMWLFGSCVFGPVLVTGVGFLPQHNKTAANLRYIQSVYEPIPPVRTLRDPHGENGHWVTPSSVRIRVRPKRSATLPNAGVTQTADDDPRINVRRVDANAR